MMTHKSSLQGMFSLRREPTPLMRLGLPTAIVALFFWAALPAAGGEKDSSSVSMDDLALQFVEIGLRFQNHDPLPYVYIGEEELRIAARADKSSLPQVMEQLTELQELLESLPDTSNATGVRRRRDLLARVTALYTRGQILSGDFPKSFDEETQKLFGVVAPKYDEAHFQELVTELDASIPGTGSLVDRIADFRKQFVIPSDKLELVIGRAMDECRERTHAHIELPPNEQVTLNLTKDMPWVGFTEYRGNSQSTVHLNSDVPVHIERAIELGCHEGYPGHHAHATLVEQELVKKRGWIEYTYIPMVGPLAVIAEGAASFAMDLVFSREQRIAFERDVLLPLAGVNGDEMDLYYRYIDLIAELNFARNEAARKYLYEGMPREDALDWLMEFGLETPGTAATRLNVIDAQRSYVVTYNLGRRLIAEDLLSHGAQGSSQSWERYFEIFLTPLSPVDLVNGGSTKTRVGLPNPAAHCASGYSVN